MKAEYLNFLGGGGGMPLMYIGRSNPTGRYIGIYNVLKLGEVNFLRSSNDVRMVTELILQ